MFEGELPCQPYLPVNLEMLLRYFQNYFQSTATGKIFWKKTMQIVFQRSAQLCFDCPRWCDQKLFCFLSSNSLCFLLIWGFWPFFSLLDFCGETNGRPTDQRLQKKSCISTESQNTVELLKTMTSKILNIIYIDIGKFYKLGTIPSLGYFGITRYVLQVLLK